MNTVESSLMSVFTDKPVVLYGHSMGSKIAFELAHILSRRGVELLRVVVSGGAAPDLESRSPTLYKLEDEAFVEEFRRLKGTPEEVLNNQDLMRLIIPFVRADYTLNDTYNFTEGEPLDCPITALGGTDDPDVNEMEIRGWERHTKSQFTYSMYSGDHFFIFEHKKEVVNEIRRGLVNPSPKLYMIQNFMDL
ncbi:MAG: thioesterase II family protein [Chitinispirillaceae bacterium]